MRRNVMFTVDENGGVMPSIPQYGGVKGEHRATAVIFTLPVSTVYTDSDVVRLSFTAGDGGTVSSDLLEDVTVTDTTATVTYELPKLITVGAGQVDIRVVVSRLDENDRETVVFQSGAATLFFEGSTVENGTPFWTGVSEMLKRTVTAKDLAVTAGEASKAARVDAIAAANNAIAARDVTVAAKDKTAAYADNARSSEDECRQLIGLAQDCKDAAEDASVAAQNAAEQAAENAASLSIGDNGNWFIGKTDTGVHAYGKSAYEIAMDYGECRTEEEWLASLKGEQGDPYRLTAADKTAIVNEVLAALPVAEGVAF